MGVPRLTKRTTLCYSFEAQVLFPKSLSSGCISIVFVRPQSNHLLALRLHCYLHILISQPLESEIRYDKRRFYGVFTAPCHRLQLLYKNLSRDEDEELDSDSNHEYHVHDIHGLFALLLHAMLPGILRRPCAETRLGHSGYPGLFHLVCRRR
jgi:hypothetical protein